MESTEYAQYSLWFRLNETIKRIPHEIILIFLSFFLVVSKACIFLFIKNENDLSTKKNLISDCCYLIWSSEYMFFVSICYDFRYARSCLLMNKMESNFIEPKDSSAWKHENVNKIAFFLSGRRKDKHYFVSDRKKHIELTKKEAFKWFLMPMKRFIFGLDFAFGPFPCERTNDIIYRRHKNANEWENESVR